MDPNIVAALIIAFATIIAALIARQKNLISDVPAEIKEKERVEKETPSAPSSITDIPKAHISRDFVIGILLVLICSVLFGGSHVLGKYIISTNVHPLVVVTLRNLFSGLFILIVALSLKTSSENKNFRIHFTKDSAYMVLGRSLSGLCYFWSFVYLSATLAITLYKLNPVYTFIMILLFIGSSFSKISFFNILFGILIAIVGSIVTVGTFNGAPSDSIFEILPGIVLIVLAGIFWSVFIVSSEKHKSSQIMKVTFWERQLYVSFVYLIATLPFILILLVSEAFWPDFLKLKEITFIEILKVLPLGLLSGTIGILYFEALKRISSLLVSVIISLEIFFTMIFESLFLRPNITWNIFLGAILIILGAVSVGRESRNLKL